MWDSGFLAGYVMNGRFGNYQNGIYWLPGKPATPFLVKSGGDSGDQTEMWDQAAIVEVNMETDAM